MRRLPLLAMFIASLWIAISYLAEEAHTKEVTKDYVQRLAPRLRKVDPWLLSTSFLERAACGAVGTCALCHSGVDRLTTIDCGPSQGRASGKTVTAIFFGVLSVPVAALHALKQAWSGGLLAFIPAVSSWVLAYAGLLFYDQKFGRARGWQFDLGARLVWSFPLGALIQWVFQLAFLGAFALIGSTLAFLGYLYYPLLALEAGLKVKHSRELVEKARASRVRDTPVR